MKIFFIQFLIIVLSIFFCSYCFNVDDDVVLNYQDVSKSYINGVLENSVTFYYNLKTELIRKSLYDNYYDFVFELKGIVNNTSQISDDSINIIRVLTNGFKVNFTVDKNLNFVYHPDVEYLYFNDPLYTKYKSKIDEVMFREFSKAIFYNFYDWFGKLKAKSYIDMIKYNFYIDYKVYYNNSSSLLYLPIGKNKYRANLFRAKANILKVDSNTDIFNNLRFIDGTINSYEYYEYDSFIPLLLQREILMRFEIDDPKIRAEYFERYKKNYLEYKVLKNLILLYK
ncbi:MAG: hypothetical protein N2169_03555 [bacterium]|nr:hypothetical protein [bacterium]